MVLQPINNKMGDNKIPPPIPIIPETKPMAAPIKKSMGHLGSGFKACSAFVQINLTMDNNKTTPSNFLYAESETGMIAPINAKGIDPAINGHNNADLKCLAL